MEVEHEAPGLGVPRERFQVLTYRLLAVDLDGTLLDDRGRVHERDRRAIAVLGQCGVSTTIVTGRLYSGARDAAAVIGVAGPMGCVDGCHLVDASTGGDLWHGGIAGEPGESLRAILRAVRPFTFLFADDRVIYDRASEAYLRYMRTWSTNQAQVEDASDNAFWVSDKGVTAVVTLAGHDATLELQSAVERELAGLVQMASFSLGSTGLWGGVIRRAGYSKGTAVEWVAKHHGIAPSEVIAIGDWYNDLPMFAVAGRSFAMGQAPEDVKAAATDTLEADSSTGGGIAEAAERAGLL